MSNGNSTQRQPLLRTLSDTDAFTFEHTQPCNACAHLVFARNLNHGHGTNSCEIFCDVIRNNFVCDPSKSLYCKNYERKQEETW